MASLRRTLLLALVGAAWMGACTFPSVDYSPTGAGGSSTGEGGGDGGPDAPDGSMPACEPSAKCLMEIKACAAKSDANEKKCTNKCKTSGDEESCKKQCASKLSEDLDECTSACVDCALAEGCAMQHAACAAAEGN